MRERFLPPISLVSATLLFAWGTWTNTKSRFMEAFSGVFVCFLWPGTCRLGVAPRFCLDRFVEARASGGWPCSRQSLQSLVALDPIQWAGGPYFVMALWASSLLSGHICCVRCRPIALGEGGVFVGTAQASTSISCTSCRVGGPGHASFLKKVGFDQVALILPAALWAGVGFPRARPYLTARGPPAFFCSAWPWLSGRKRITRLRTERIGGRVTRQGERRRSTDGRRVPSSPATLFP